MYIHSVKLINFKSIGDYPESEIILEPKVTSIIGKNESGKSNVINGLAHLSLITNDNTAFSPELINRIGSDQKQIKYIITLKPSPKDNENGLSNDTIIQITKDSYEATGGILLYIQQEMQSYINALIEILGPEGTNPLQLRDKEWASYKTFYNELIKRDMLNIPKITAAFDFIEKQSGKISEEKRNSLKQIIGICKEKWMIILDLFPIIYYRNSDKQLFSKYKYEEVEKELKNPITVPKSLLSDFVKLIDIPIDDFLSAARSGSSGSQSTIRRRIIRLINDKINKPFQNFYHTEKFSLDLDFNSGTISFLAQSENGETLMLSERSNGLKWYLDMFIDTHANNIPEKNVLYLLDEPGISLHVNAQKELIKLFDHLSNSGNQVVYTTHSPYMLDLESEGIHRIRAVVKNAEGFTYIYKTAYDSRITPKSQQDTLAPIISALGMSLNYTLGPAKNKINIVTEGMSDYIYLSTMAKLLGIDTDRYVILPSVGATNCINICTILHGWGCPYIAVFDYDESGVRKGGEYLRKEMMLEYKHQYCYLLDVTQEEVNQKTYKNHTYMIEDLVTREEISRFCRENNTSESIGKPLMAKLISNAIELGTFQLNEECQNNFQLLFKRIVSYCKD